MTAAATILALAAAGVTLGVAAGAALTWWSWNVEQRRARTTKPPRRQLRPIVTAVDLETAAHAQALALELVERAHELGRQ